MEDEDGIQPPGFPHVNKDTDLSVSPRHLQEAGRKLERSTNARINAEYRSPAEMMRELGFSPSRYMNPLQFLVAMLNDDVELIYKNKKKREMTLAKGGLSIQHRLEAAKTAAKYMHMAMPTVNVNKNEGASFGAELAAAVSAGDQRVRTRRMIIETVEKISPNEPIAQASYPPVFSAIVDARAVDYEDADYAENSPADEELQGHARNYDGD
jgi:hypothetical protein